MPPRNSRDARTTRGWGRASPRAKCTNASATSAVVRPTRLTRRSGPQRTWSVRITTRWPDSTSRPGWRPLAQHHVGAATGGGPDPERLRLEPEPAELPRRRTAGQADHVGEGDTAVLGRCRARMGRRRLRRGLRLVAGARAAADEERCGRGPGRAAPLMGSRQSDARCRLAVDRSGAVPGGRCARQCRLFVAPASKCCTVGGSEVEERARLVDVDVGLRGVRLAGWLAGFGFFSGSSLGLGLGLGLRLGLVVGLRLGLGLGLGVGSGRTSENVAAWLSAAPAESSFVGLVGLLGSSSSASPRPPASGSRLGLGLWLGLRLRLAATRPRVRRCRTASRRTEVGRRLGGCLGCGGLDGLDRRVLGLRGSGFRLWLGLRLGLGLRGRLLGPRCRTASRRSRGRSRLGGCLGCGASRQARPARPRSRCRPRARPRARLGSARRARCRTASRPSRGRSRARRVPRLRGSRRARPALPRARRRRRCRTASHRAPVRRPSLPARAPSPRPSRLRLRLVVAAEVEERAAGRRLAASASSSGSSSAVSGVRLVVGVVAGVSNSDEPPPDALAAGRPRRSR